jgi:hypothetical protein
MLLLLLVVADDWNDQSQRRGTTSEPTANCWSVHFQSSNKAQRKKAEKARLIMSFLRPTTCATISSKGRA